MILVSTRERKPIALRHPRHHCGRMLWHESRSMTQLGAQKTHMNDHKSYRNLLFVLDIRISLLYSSLVTPNQQLKQSLQTFAARPADETRHLTSQSQPVLKDELSDGPDRTRRKCSNLLTLSAGSLEGAVIDPWMQATRHGRVDFAEVCCTSQCRRMLDVPCKTVTGMDSISYLATVQC